MPTLTGTYVRSDGTPARGGVTFTPSVAITGDDDIILPAACRIDLDADGSFEVDLPATNDPEWTPSGWVWQIEERIPGGRTWAFELTAAADISDLAPVDVPDSYLPWSFTATTTTGAPGTDAAVDVTGTAPAPVFEFTIPRGDQGEVGPANELTVGTVSTLPPGSPATADITGTPPSQTLDLGIPEGVQGNPGPANELSIGTVTTLPPGDPATADITGTPPSQTLDLSIPQGDKGDKGDTGDTGPANELAIGTVTTGAAGSSASATITGTPPSQTLDLTIPKGDKGDTGDVAPGNIGNLFTANIATGTDTLADTTGFLGQAATLASSTDYAWQGTRSLKVTVTSTNNRAAIGGSTASGTIPVTAGLLYTFAAYVLAPSAARPIAARIYWWTSAGNVAASTGNNVGNSVTTSTSWQRASVTAAAPANAAFASVMLFGTTGWTNGEVRYEDGYTFHVGAGGLWVPPGIPVPNLGIRANPSDATQAQVWNPGNNTWITV